MLDEFKKEDALPGMVFVLRSGSEVNMGFLNWYNYSDDMRLVGDVPDGVTREAADVMQVRLPSGRVLWERPTETPAAMACSGCDRDGSGDPLCCGCMRGGHGMTVDFYRPKVGP